MRHILRTAFAAIIFWLVFATSAFAKPEYLAVFLDVYKVHGDKLTERSCANCHVSTSDYTLNLYGKQVAHALHDANGKEMTPAILKAVEPLDANGDGKSNLDEINAGTAPGAFVAGKTAAPPAATPKEKPLVPKNFFHPAIIHFPIALFIGGLLLDLIGYLRKSDSFYVAGWYNLLFGAISAFGGIASGYIATLMMHIPISGLIQRHMILAISGTAIMWILVGIRAKRHEKVSGPLRLAYIALAISGLVLISWSGHLGGAFVYGE